MNEYLTTTLGEEHRNELLAEARANRLAREASAGRPTWWPRLSAPGHPLGGRAPSARATEPCTPAEHRQPTEGPRVVGDKWHHDFHGAKSEDGPHPRARSSVGSTSSTGCAACSTRWSATAAGSSSSVATPGPARPPSCRPSRPSSAGRSPTARPSWSAASACRWAVTACRTRRSPVRCASWSSCHGREQILDWAGAGRVGPRGAAAGSDHRAADSRRRCGCSCSRPSPGSASGPARRGPLVRGDRGHPLGRRVDPAPAALPGPGPDRRSGAGHRDLPDRRADPPAPAAPVPGRDGSASRASSDSRCRAWSASEVAELLTHAAGSSAERRWSPISSTGAARASPTSWPELASSAARGCVDMPDTLRDALSVRISAPLRRGRRHAPAGRRRRQPGRSRSCWRRSATGTAGRAGRRSARGGGRLGAGGGRDGVRVPARPAARGRARRHAARPARPAARPLRPAAGGAARAGRRHRGLRDRAPLVRGPRRTEGLHAGPSGPRLATSAARRRRTSRRSSCTSGRWSSGTRFPTPRRSPGRTSRCSTRRWPRRATPVRSNGRWCWPTPPWPRPTPTTCSAGSAAWPRRVSCGAA